MKLQNASLTIPSNVDSITLIERMVDDLSSSHCIDTELYGKVLLAVVEGVNNAVVHGNKLHPDKYVTVKYSIDKEFITFSIIDQGDGFDFSKVPDPTSSENIEKPHGRGIFLMNHLADEIEFYQNGSHIKMFFKL